MKRLSIITALAATALASAKPDIQSALAFDTPESYRDTPAAQPQALPAQWWTLYKDAELNALIEKALLHNQDLSAAGSRVDQARAAVGQVRAGLFPQLNLAGSAQRQKSAFTSGQASDYVNLPAQLSFEIDLWGKLRKSSRAARADADAQSDLYAAAELSLSAQVAEALFALRASKQEERIVADSIVTRREARELAQARLDIGDAAEIDVARANTELATVEADLAAVQQRSSQLQNALAVLVGSVAPEFEAKDNDLPQAIVLPSDIPSSVLSNRPDVAAAEKSLAAAADRIGVARANFYPSLSLNGSAGWESFDFGSVVNRANETWSLGPQLYLPLFQGGRNKARLARATAVFDEQTAVFKQQVLEAIEETQNAFSTDRFLSQRLTATERAAESAQNAVALSKTRYDNGFVSYLEVVDSQRTALTAERQRVQLQFLKLANSISLIKALGGGWQNGET